jgi:nickel-type superoxide dismutase maturation protease
MRESKGKEIILWMIRLRQRYRVSGASMQPLLAAGDEVLVDLKAYRRQSPSIGDIIVARHPTQTDLQIIKRIQQIQEGGSYLLSGDNTDPTQNSPCLVPRHLILGQVTSRFATAT